MPPEVVDRVQRQLDHIFELVRSTELTDKSPLGAAAGVPGDGVAGR
jgi:hypothetical protein